MAHVFALQENQSPPWGIIPLEGSDVYYLRGDPDCPVAVCADGSPPGPAYLMRHPGPNGQDTWLLFASGHENVSINGQRLDLAIRCLRHKDEVRLGRSVLLFSLEEQAGVVSFPGIGKPCKCARCKQEILPGTPAVRCPNARCGVWHHQSQESPCWTYAETCAALCGQPTSLEAGLQWVPEGP